MFDYWGVAIRIEASQLINVFPLGWSLGVRINAALIREVEC
jgi:hypothetical protein